jgi:hypothetical protein
MIGSGRKVAPFRILNPSLSFLHHAVESLVTPGGLYRSIISDFVFEVPSTLSSPAGRAGE